MDHTEVSRREFARNLAGIAAVPVVTVATVSVGLDRQLLRSAAAADTTSVAKDSSRDATAAAANASKDAEQQREIPEHAWLLGLILQRYPDDRLDEAAVLGILRDVRADIARSNQLSRFPLTNADEPAFVFRAWRAD